MWHSVNEHISTALHTSFRLTDKTELRSPSSQRLFKISDSKRQFLVKVDSLSAFEQFDCEIQSRNLLIRDSDFLVADTITSGCSKEYSFLVLEYLEADNKTENWALCGKVLAKMHNRQEQQMFGAEEDNYFLNLPQPNRWHKKWEVFFAEERIAWQLQMLSEKQINLVDIDTFVDRIKQHIPHHISPSLLHGHFWRGNIDFHNGHPVVTDPSCYYGDRGFDIAICELFNPLADDFYSGYQSVLPHQLTPISKDIYQLYFLLALANKYAGDYLKKAQQKIYAIEHAYL